MRINRIKLIAAMAERDITAIELAKKAGVSRSTLTAARTGKSCNYNTIYRIARALGIEVSSLLYEEGGGSNA